jgi:hypothetical protein
MYVTIIALPYFLIGSDVPIVILWWCFWCRLIGVRNALSWSKDAIVIFFSRCLWDWQVGVVPLRDLWFLWRGFGSFWKLALAKPTAIATVSNACLA